MKNRCKTSSWPDLKPHRGRLPTEPTVDRPYLLAGTPWGDIYINPSRMGCETAKLGPGIYTFDLSPKVTCGDHLPCWGACYARPAEARRPTVHNARLVNSWLATTSSWSPLEGLLMRQINSLLLPAKRPVVTLRLHGAGDFGVGDDYPRMWRRILTYYGDDVRAYFYTRCLKNPTVRALASLPTVNAIDSTIPCAGGKRFTSDGAELEKLRADGWYVCPATTGADVRCGVECSYCILIGRDRVVFKQHR